MSGADGGPFAELRHRLEAEARERFLYTGAQIVAVHENRKVADISVGVDHLHRPVTSDALFALYCVGKPFISVAILRLVAERELSLDDELQHVLPEETAGSWLGRITIESLLRHSAGLHVLNMVFARILPPSSRLAWIRGAQPDPRFRVGVDTAYAPFASWHLLGMVIEEVSDRSYSSFVEDVVVKGYGISAADVVIRFTPERFAAESTRIAVGLDMTFDPPIPLLAEAGSETACEWNPAYGAYATMRGVADLYSGLMRDLAGANEVLPGPILRAATAVTYSARYDEGLGRDGAFALGFMVDLNGEHYGRSLSGAAFGHSGPGAAGFGLADPESGCVIAAMFNSIVDVDTSDALRRRRLVDEIHEICRRHA